MRSPIDRFSRIDNLVAEFLAEIEPRGELRLRQRFHKRYRPVETLEGTLVDCLAMLSWRLHGCYILESGILEDGALPFIPDILRDLRDPGVLSKLSRYQAMLARHAENCRRQLDRYADSRKTANAEAAARLRKLKPCTSVIQ